MQYYNNQQANLMRAIIYQPSRSVTQSGKGKDDVWVLTFENQSPLRIEPLMGWTAQKEALSQVRLQFDTKERAIEYARKKKIEYQVRENRRSKRFVKAVYADNFKHNRKDDWTH